MYAHRSQFRNPAMHTEPPHSLVLSLAVARAERGERTLWIAGRLESDRDSWRLYRPADRPAYRPVSLPDFPTEAA